jgi:PIN domain nuclease of toxin-antitoxin system
VWALSNPGLLSPAACKVLAAANVVASVASLWELCVKSGRKNALLADPIRWWEQYVAGSGVAAIPIRDSHVMVLGSLSKIHGDPFDRILVAQAVVEKLPLVTKDKQLAEYGIPIIW